MIKVHFVKRANSATASTCLSLLLSILCVRESLQERLELADTVEYCPREPFEGKCLRNEVIVMRNALYGRMRIGRCLAAEGDVSEFRNDPRFVGCYVDVLHVLDKRCSGKNQCEVIPFIDVDLSNERPCLASLQRYMEASYECVTVIEEDRNCFALISSNQFHIMRSWSISNAKQNCGTKSQPWRLEAPPGQQINISLLDFGPKTPNELQIQHSKCRQYGYIIDKSSNKNQSICGLDYERKADIYKSLSNVIEIVLTTASSLEDSQQVLIGVKAIGCSNLVPPEDTWLRRNGNDAIVGCYASHQTWHLRCVNNQWIGVIGNCTRELVDYEKQPVGHLESPPNFAVNYQVLVTVGIGFLGMVVCVVIIICGIVCMKRYSLKSMKDYQYSTADKGAACLRITTNQSSLNNGVNSELLA